MRWTAAIRAAEAEGCAVPTTVELRPTSAAGADVGSGAAAASSSGSRRLFVDGEMLTRLMRFAVVPTSAMPVPALLGGDLAAVEAFAARIVRAFRSRGVELAVVMDAPVSSPIEETLKATALPAQALADREAAQADIVTRVLESGALPPMRAPLRLVAADGTTVRLDEAMALAAGEAMGSSDDSDDAAAAGADAAAGEDDGAALDDDDEAAGAADAAADPHAAAKRAVARRLARAYAAAALLPLPEAQAAAVAQTLVGTLKAESVRVWSAGMGSGRHAAARAIAAGADASVIGLWSDAADACLFPSVPVVSVPLDQLLAAAGWTHANNVLPTAAAGAAAAAPAAAPAASWAGPGDAAAAAAVALSLTTRTREHAAAALDVPAAALPALAFLTGGLSDIAPAARVRALCREYPHLLPAGGFEGRPAAAVEWLQANVPEHGSLLRVLLEVPHRPALLDAAADSEEAGRRREALLLALAALQLVEARYNGALPSGAELLASAAAAASGAAADKAAVPGAHAALPIAAALAGSAGGVAPADAAALSTASAAAAGLLPRRAIALLRAAATELRAPLALEYRDLPGSEPDAEGAITAAAAAADASNAALSTLSSFTAMLPLAAAQAGLTASPAGGAQLFALPKAAAAGAAEETTADRLRRRELLAVRCTLGRGRRLHGFVAPVVPAVGAALAVDAGAAVDGPNGDLTALSAALAASNRFTLPADAASAASPAAAATEALAVKLAAALSPAQRLGYLAWVADLPTNSVATLPAGGQAPLLPAADAGAVLRVASSEAPALSATAGGLTPGQTAAASVRYLLGLVEHIARSHPVRVRAAGLFARHHAAVALAQRAEEDADDRAAAQAARELAALQREVLPLSAWERFVSDLRRLPSLSELVTLLAMVALLDTTPAAAADGPSAGAAGASLPPLADPAIFPAPARPHVRAASAASWYSTAANGLLDTATMLRLVSDGVSGPLVAGASADDGAAQAQMVRAAAAGGNTDAASAVAAASSTLPAAPLFSRLFAGRLFHHMAFALDADGYGGLMAKDRRLFFRLTDAPADGSSVDPEGVAEPAAKTTSAAAEPAAAGGAGAGAADAAPTEFEWRLRADPLSVPVDATNEARRKILGTPENLLPQAAKALLSAQPGATERLRALFAAAIAGLDGLRLLQDFAAIVTLSAIRPPFFVVPVIDERDDEGDMDAAARKRYAAEVQVAAAAAASGSAPAAAGAAAAASAPEEAGAARPARMGDYGAAGGAGAPAAGVYEPSVGEQAMGAPDYLLAFLVAGRGVAGLKPSSESHKERLPIGDAHDAIIKRVAASSFSLILTDTGSGKTTGMPQMLLHQDRFGFEKHARGNVTERGGGARFRGLLPFVSGSRRQPRIVAALPRVLAAQRAAERVDSEFRHRAGPVYGIVPREDACYVGFAGGRSVQSSPEAPITYTSADYLLHCLLGPDGVAPPVEDDMDEADPNSAAGAADAGGKGSQSAAALADARATAAARGRKLSPFPAPLAWADIAADDAGRAAYAESVGGFYYGERYDPFGGLLSISLNRLGISKVLADELHERNMGTELLLVQLGQMIADDAKARLELMQSVLVNETLPLLSAAVAAYVASDLRPKDRATVNNAAERFPFVDAVKKLKEADKTAVYASIYRVALVWANRPRVVCMSATYQPAVLQRYVQARMGAAVRRFEDALAAEIVTPPAGAGGAAAAAAASAALADLVPRSLADALSDGRFASATFVSRMAGRLPSGMGATQVHINDTVPLLALVTAVLGVPAISEAPSPHSRSILYLDELSPLQLVLSDKDNGAARHALSTFTESDASPDGSRRGASTFNELYGTTRSYFDQASARLEAIERTEAEAAAAGRPKPRLDPRMAPRLRLNNMENQASARLVGTLGLSRAVGAFPARHWRHFASRGGLVESDAVLAFSSGDGEVFSLLMGMEWAWAKTAEAAAAAPFAVASEADDCSLDTAWEALNDVSWIQRAPPLLVEGDRVCELLLAADNGSGNTPVPGCLGFLRPDQLESLSDASRPPAYTAEWMADLEQRINSDRPKKLAAAAAADGAAPPLVGVPNQAHVATAESCVREGVAAVGDAWKFTDECKKAKFFSSAAALWDTIYGFAAELPLFAREKGLGDGKGPMVRERFVCAAAARAVRFLRLEVAELRSLHETLKEYDAFNPPEPASSASAAGGAMSIVAAAKAQKKAAAAAAAAALAAARGGKGAGKYGEEESYSSAAGGGGGGGDDDEDEDPFSEHRARYQQLLQTWSSTGIWARHVRAAAEAAAWTLARWPKVIKMTLAKTAPAATALRFVEEHRRIAAATADIAHGLFTNATLLVATTNMAETSITIGGVHTVVDLCQHSDLTILPKGSLGMERFWINKSAAAQRAGRCGRTPPPYWGCSHVVYRLVTRAFFRQLKATPTPTMQHYRPSSLVMRLVDLLTRYPDSMIARMAMGGKDGAPAGGNLWRSVADADARQVARILECTLAPEAVGALAAQIGDAVAAMRQAGYLVRQPSSAAAMPALEDADAPAAASLVRHTFAGSLAAALPVDPVSARFVLAGLANPAVLPEALVMAAFSASASGRRVYAGLRYFATSSYATTERRMEEAFRQVVSRYLLSLEGGRAAATAAGDAADGANVFSDHIMGVRLFALVTFAFDTFGGDVMARIVGDLKVDDAFVRELRATVSRLVRRLLICVEGGPLAGVFGAPGSSSRGLWELLLRDPMRAPAAHLRQGEWAALLRDTLSGLRPSAAALFKATPAQMRQLVVTALGGNLAQGSAMVDAEAVQWRKRSAGSWPLRNTVFIEAGSAPAAWTASGPIADAGQAEGGRAAQASKLLYAALAAAGLWYEGDPPAVSDAAAAKAASAAAAAAGGAGDAAASTPAAAATGDGPESGPTTTWRERIAAKAADASAAAQSSSSSSSSSSSATPFFERAPLVALTSVGLRDRAAAVIAPNWDAFAHAFQGGAGSAAGGAGAGGAASSGSLQLWKKLAGRGLRGALRDENPVRGGRLRLAPDLSTALGLSAIAANAGRSSADLGYAQPPPMVLALMLLLGGFDVTGTLPESDAEPAPPAIGRMAEGVAAGLPLAPRDKKKYASEVESALDSAPGGRGTSALTSPAFAPAVVGASAGAEAARSVKALLRAAYPFYTAWTTEVPAAAGSSGAVVEEAPLALPTPFTFLAPSSSSAAGGSDASAIGFHGRAFALYGTVRDLGDGTDEAGRSRRKADAATLLWSSPAATTLALLAARPASSVRLAVAARADAVASGAPLQLSEVFVTAVTFDEGDSTQATIELPLPASAASATVAAGVLNLQAAASALRLRGLIAAVDANLPCVVNPRPEAGAPAAWRSPAVWGVRDLSACFASIVAGAACAGVTPEVAGAPAAAGLWSDEHAEAGWSRASVAASVVSDLPVDNPSTPPVFDASVGVLAALGYGAGDAAALRSRLTLTAGDRRLESAALPSGRVGGAAPAAAAAGGAGGFAARRTAGAAAAAAASSYTGGSRFVTSPAAMPAGAGAAAPPAATAAAATAAVAASKPAPAAAAAAPATTATAAAFEQARPRRLDAPAARKDLLSVLAEGLLDTLDAPAARACLLAGPSIAIKFDERECRDGAVVRLYLAEDVDAAVTAWKNGQAGQREEQEALLRDAIVPAGSTFTARKLFVRLDAPGELGESVKRLSADGKPLRVFAVVADAPVAASAPTSRFGSRSVTASVAAAPAPGAAAAPAPAATVAPAALTAAPAAAASVVAAAAAALASPAVAAAEPAAAASGSEPIVASSTETASQTRFSSAEPPRTLAAVLSRPPLLELSAEDARACLCWREAKTALLGAEDVPAGATVQLFIAADAADVATQWRNGAAGRRETEERLKAESGLVPIAGDTKAFRKVSVVLEAAPFAAHPEAAAAAAATAATGKMPALVALVLQKPGSATTSAAGSRFSSAATGAATTATASPSGSRFSSAATPAVAPAATTTGGAGAASAVPPAAAAVIAASEPASRTASGPGSAPALTFAERQRLRREGKL